MKILKSFLGQSRGRVLVPGLTAAMLFVPGLQGQAIAQLAGATGLFAVAGLARGLAQPKQSARHFADGGTVFSPTYSLTGEYQNARTNPEWITPVDKGAGLIAGELMAMGGLGGGGGTLTTRVSGSDLLIVLDRAKTRSRVFGNG